MNRITRLALSAALTVAVLGTGSVAVALIAAPAATPEVTPARPPVSGVDIHEPAAAAPSGFSPAAASTRGVAVVDPSPEPVVVLPEPEPIPVTPVTPGPDPVPVPTVPPTTLPEPIPVPPVDPFWPAGSVGFTGDLWVNAIPLTGVPFAFVWDEDLTTSGLWAVYDDEIIEVCGGELVQVAGPRTVFIGESRLLGPWGTCYIQQLPNDPSQLFFTVILEDAQWAIGLLRPSEQLPPVPVDGVLGIEP